MEWLKRTEILAGEDGIKKLKNAHVLIVGLGGVGGYAAEQIARSGVGEMTIIDCDTVSESNINRQLIAMHSTVGKSKVELLSDRIKDINPQIKLNNVEAYITYQNVDALFTDIKYDYVVDAIDTLSPKVALIRTAIANKCKLVSSFGAGGRFDPTMIQVSEVEKSFGDKLGFHVRKRLRKFGIEKGFKVVFSPEQVPDSAWYLGEGERNKKGVVGTISYMPPAFGCILASVVIRELLSN